MFPIIFGGCAEEMVT